LAILALLAERPMHGYQLIQEISRRSAGGWRPSPGSVYPTLQQLEDEGLVRAEEREGKRVYSLTADGRAFADERADEFATLWDGYQPSDGDAELGDLVFGVATAFVHVMRTGSERQVAAARRVLARTRADLYRILGEDAAGRGGPAPMSDQEPEVDEGDNGDTGRSDADAAEPGDDGEQDGDGSGGRP
jgi:DNA-binding PadR family transcriptional regulator